MAKPAPVDRRDVSKLDGWPPNIDQRATPSRLHFMILDTGQHVA